MLVVAPWQQAGCCCCRDDKVKMAGKKQKENPVGCTGDDEK